jgi:hypothetical protein
MRLMANLREAYSRVSFASLEWDENAEKAIDRVAAAALANPLGLLLWKAKYLLEGDAYRRAQIALGEVYGKRYRDAAPIRAALVGQALREFLAPACRTCRGVGEHMLEDRRVVCDTCAGTKIHRYTDMERAGTMQLSFGLTKHAAHKLQWLLGLMGDEDRQVNAVMCEQLER